MRWLGLRSRPTDDVATAAWPLPSLPDLLGQLSRRSGGLTAAGPAGAITGADGLDRQVERAAARLDLEAEPVTAHLVELGRLAAPASPALMLVSVSGQPGLLALIGGNRGSVVALSPAGHRVRLPLAAVGRSVARSVDGADTMAQVAMGNALGEVDDRMRLRLETDRLLSRTIAGLWLLRPAPWVPFGRQLRTAGLPRRAGGALAAHAVQHALLLGSWWVVGRGVFAGDLAPGWWLAWLLLLLSVTPFRALEFEQLAILAARGGALLKRRLLWGAMRMPPDDVRHQGAGQVFGRVVDAEAFENLALSGGHVGGIAAVELALAFPVLAMGAGGWLAAGLLVGWTLLALGLAAGAFRARIPWTENRLAMTHDLVERMVGQRTVVAQLPPLRWHLEEDAALEEYAERSRRLDRTTMALQALIPRGWLLLGVASIGPALVAGSSSPALLAVGLGGALFAYRAFLKLVRGLADLGEAWVAWRNVQPLFAAGAHPTELGAEIPLPEPTAGQPTLEARRVGFRYPGRPQVAVADCDLVVRAGERVVLSGPSGAGKSTLAALLGGLRRPTSGLVLLEGLDLASVGEERWRRYVAVAPQLHENHVLTETLAFNLLLGRGWPPAPGDLAEAEAACHALGLGDLLARMPAGVLEVVGEGGWRLSHGERARVLLARALLQDARVLVVDEGLASLDPDTLQVVLKCLAERSEAVITIAHR